MALVDRGWLDAWWRFEGGYRGFARDVQQAEAAVRREFGDAKWEWRLRCQLALCSIANMGSNVPPEVIAANVSSNLISIREALYIAGQQSAERCAESLRLLLPLIPDSLLLEAIDVACKLKGTYIGLAEVLCGRVLSCPARDRGVIVPAAISCLNNLVSGRRWGHFFNQLYLLLPPIERGSAISIALAKAISDEKRNANVPLPFQWDTGEQRDECVGALASIAPNLAEHFDDFSELTGAIPAITGVLCRLEYGAVITSFLPPDQRKSIVESLLDAAKRYEAVCDEDRARMDLDKSSPLKDNSALAAITPALVGRPTDIAAALLATETIQDPFRRADALGALLPLLADEQRDEVISKIFSLSYNEKRGDGIRRESLPLLAKYPDRLIQLAQPVRDADFAAFLIPVLAASAHPSALALILPLAERIPESWFPELVSSVAAFPAAKNEAVTLAHSVQDPALRAKILTASLLDLLAEEERIEAVAESLKTAPSAFLLELTCRRPKRCHVVAEALRRYPTLAADAVAAASSIEYSSNRVWALVGAVVSEGHQEYILDEISRFAEDRNDASEAGALFVTAANFLPPERREACLKKAWEALTRSSFWRGAQSDDDDDRLRLLDALLNEASLVSEMFRHFSAIRDEREQATLLITLLEKISDTKHQPKMMRDALLAAYSADHGAGGKTSAIGSIVPIIKTDSALVSEAQALADDIKDPYLKADAFTALAINLEESQRRPALIKAIAAARTCIPSGDAFEARNADNLLSKIIDRVLLVVDRAPELLPELKSAAQTIDDKETRFRSMISLALKMNSSDSSLTLQSAFTSLNKLSPKSRSLLLSSIIQIIQDVGPNEQEGELIAEIRKEKERADRDTPDEKDGSREIIGPEDENFVDESDRREWQASNLVSRLSACVGDDKDSILHQLHALFEDAAQNEDDDVLGILFPALPSSTFAEYLDALMDRFDQDRSSWRSMVAEAVARGQQLHAHHVVSSGDAELRLARLLVSLRSMFDTHLAILSEHPRVVARLVEQTQFILVGTERAAVLASLASSLSEAERTSLLAEALDVAVAGFDGALTNEDLHSRFAALSTIVRVAASLSTKTVFLNAVPELFSAAQGRSWDLVEALRLVNDLMPAENDNDILRRFLRLLPFMPRRDGFLIIRELLPRFERRGGQAALGEMWQAVVDITKWFP
jgi:hypothetical protein